NALHFRDSWVRLLSPKTASAYAYFLFDIENAVDFNKGKILDPDALGIKVLDNQTLEVRLTKPVAFFPSLLSFMVTYPIRLDLIKKYGDHWTDPDKLVTCGPFMLKDYWPEYRIKLAQNSFYGGAPKPSLKQITFFIVPDATTALTLAESGLIDVSPIPPLALPHYQNDAHLVRQNKLRGTYFGFNLRQKPFDDVNFRKALALSLNKKELPEILKGGEKPIDSWIVPPLLAFNDQLGLKFDPAQAKQYLAQSTYGKNQELTLYFNSDAVIKKIAEWAASLWAKNLGITVHLENMEWKAYLSKLHHEPPGFFRLGWGADYPDPDNFMNLFTTASGNNFTGFHSPDYDQLVSEAASTLDTNKRIELYNEAQTMLLEDQCVIIPLYVASQYLWVNQKFAPYPITPMDFAYLKKIKTHATH
ncbi:MAG: hypothetical protein ACD_73C00559G0001, partial [uncultured bacterium]